MTASSSPGTGALRNTAEWDRAGRSMLDLRLCSPEAALLTGRLLSLLESTEVRVDLAGPDPRPRMPHSGRALSGLGGLALGATRPGASLTRAGLEPGEAGQPSTVTV